MEEKIAMDFYGLAWNQIGHVPTAEARGLGKWKLS